MVVFAIGVENSLDAAIQGPHDADAREHGWSAKLHDKQKTFHCRLLYRYASIPLGFGIAAAG